MSKERLVTVTKIVATEQIYFGIRLVKNMEIIDCENGIFFAQDRQRIGFVEPHAPPFDSCVTYFLEFP